MARTPWILAAIALITGCSDESGNDRQPDPDPTPSAFVVANAEDSAAAPRLQRPRFLPDEMRRATRPESFAHDAHAQIDCAVCHQDVQGHGVHAALACSDCHRASALTTVGSLDRDECLACHHGPGQVRSCEYCHERPTISRTTRLFDLEVFAAAREREVTFSHAVHQGEACVTCHREMPTLSPASSCSSCHEEHHTGAARCASCHPVAPEGAHDLEVHQTCSGAGCHREPAVEAIALSKPVCLACHQDREMHEPDGDCVGCHRVQPSRHYREPRR